MILYSYHAPLALEMILGVVENAMSYLKLKAPHIQLIKQAMIELLVNAATHGNHLSKTKSILILLKREQDYIFEVTDEGDGFDFKKLSAHKMPSDEQTHGRGLAFITQIGVKLSFKLSGRCAILTVSEDF